MSLAIKYATKKRMKKPGSDQLEVAREKLDKFKKMVSDFENGAPGESGDAEKDKEWNDRTFPGRMAKGGMAEDDGRKISSPVDNDGANEVCPHGSMMCPMCHGGKMAKGGFVEEEEASGYEPDPEPEGPVTLEDKEKFRGVHGDFYARGGEVDGSGFSDDMVDRIMKHRYSKGGQVANETGMSADFEPNQFDDLVKDDDLEFSDTGKNSGDEIGNEQEDEDRHDIVKRIMKSRAKKDKMPRPA